MNSGTGLTLLSTAPAIRIILGVAWELEGVSSRGVCAGFDASCPVPLLKDREERLILPTFSFLSLAPALALRAAVGPNEGDQVQYGRAM